MKHIFVRTVRYREDPFRGLCEYVSHRGAGEIIRVDLDDEDFGRVWKVEYSIRKHFRVLYYRKIFEFLRRRLIAVIPTHAPCVVYFSDEGVWAEVWRDVRRQIGNPKLYAVNVQHGFTTMAAVNTRRVRAILNMLSRAAFGYPNFGLGSAGGSGRFAFDAYLTYDAPTARMVAGRTGAIALATPYLIKSDALTRASSTPFHSHPVEGPVLFALQPRIRGSLVKGDLRATLDQLEPLARALKQLRKTLLLRLHPGMNRDIALQTYRRHRISGIAALDEVADLYQSLLAADAVMSFYSTVLWEAHLLGLAVVQVQSLVCKTAALPYPHYDLDLTMPFADQLARILEDSARQRTPTVQVREQREWQAMHELYSRWFGIDGMGSLPSTAFTALVNTSP